MVIMTMMMTCVYMDPFAHSATGSVNSTGGCMQKTVKNDVRCPTKDDFGKKHEAQKMSMTALFTFALFTISVLSVLYSTLLRLQQSSTWSHMQVCRRLKV